MKLGKNYLQPSTCDQDRSDVVEDGRDQHSALAGYLTPEWLGEHMRLAAARWQE